MLLPKAVNSAAMLSTSCVHNMASGSGPTGIGDDSYDDQVASASASGL